jgi:hypothetical protein
MTTEPIAVTINIKQHNYIIIFITKDKRYTKVSKK